MSANIMTLQHKTGMSAAEMRTEAMLFRSLAEQMEPREAGAYAAMAEQIEAAIPDVERAEAAAVDDFLNGVSTADLMAAVARREGRPW